MTKTQDTEENAISWGCPQCGKVMGSLFRHRVHIRPRDGHIYFSHYPVTGVCSKCGCRNTIRQCPSR